MLNSYSFSGGAYPINPYFTLSEYGQGYGGTPLPKFQRDFYGNLAPVPNTAIGSFGSGAGPGGTAAPSFWEGMIGTKDNPGWGGLALGGAQALGSLFMGMKQYGLAKKSLEESKRQFQMNYDAQKNLTNSYMEDRQRARIAANPNAGYASPEEHMSKWGLK